MSAVVWKYQIALTDEVQTIEMPAGSRVLRVAGQWNLPAMWVLVDPDALRVPRHFTVCGTGHPAPAGNLYVGTAEIGEYVWHVFEMEPAI